MNRCSEEQLRELELISLEKRRLGGDLPAFYNSLKRRRSVVAVGFFYLTTSDRTRKNALELHEERFRLSSRRNFSTKRVIKCTNTFP